MVLETERVDDINSINGFNATELYLSKQFKWQILCIF